MKGQKEVVHNDKNQEKTYLSIRKYIINAQNKVKSAVNYAMVNAYWEIGKQIYLACGESERAAYGKQLLQYISEKLTVEFGKGFDVTNLRNMRRFYLMFPIRETLSLELSWSHYIKLMRVADKSDTLVRYTLPEDNKQIYAAKYLPYMPTEEELRRELNLEEFKKID